MIDLARWQKLKAAVDLARRDADRAEGVRAMLLATLEREHGCRSVEEGREKLRGLRGELAAKEAEFASCLATFEAEFGGKLDED